MPLERCKKCGRMHYGTDPCPAPAREGSSAAEHQPSKLGVEGSTPSPRSKRKPQRQGKANKLKDTAKALPAARKRKPGRPKTITDMRAYKAMKQREYRARQKAKGETDARDQTNHPH